MSGLFEICLYSQPEGSNLKKEESYYNNLKKCFDHLPNKEESSLT